MEWSGAKNSLEGIKKKLTALKTFMKPVARVENASSVLLPEHEQQRHVSFL